jgi:hypothetical protein
MGTEADRGVTKSDFLSMIARAFKEPRAPKVIGIPDQINSPKEYLSKLITRTYDRRYVNTIHNERIAEHIDVSRLLRVRALANYSPWIKQLAGGSGSRRSQDKGGLGVAF